MSLKKILLTGVSLLLVSSSVFAADISCPAVSSVQFGNSKLDTANNVELATYTVSSAYVAFRESNLPWYIRVNNVKATTVSKAKAAAKEIVRNTSVKKNEKATLKDDHYYYCYYGEGDIVVSSGYVSK
jgi:hypothetical protein